MKKLKVIWILALASLVFVPGASSREKPQPDKAGAQASASPSTESPSTSDQKQNIQEYVALLRANVQQQKAEMMGAVMQLSAADAAKFWPIYSEYDAQLTKINDLRAANIQEYARTYSQMTDAKADELIQNALSYETQRSQLLAKYYGLVKQALGATTAARFIQVEHQLLLIIDLQVASSLPIVGGGQ